LFGKASGELYRDTALGNNQPMFILPPGAKIAVVVDQQVDPARKEHPPEMRNVTPEQNQSGLAVITDCRENENGPTG
jgi:hypothetical protein